MGEPLLWIQDATRCRFPLLSEEAKRFPTSYLVEKGFSAVTRIQDKTRNRVDVVQRGAQTPVYSENFSGIHREIVELNLHCREEFSERNFSVHRTLANLAQEAR
ncbi:hypothetical protein chiPu_0019342 [Chiloscyllium punctatum]|uniref:SCAN domain-containing protein 3 n=1 Tax=Chiloscyllium punctatum TaxID=137246 RepID=A0A401RRL4_CHIPU|nr:hypothetical protein [Chiloscyllium punctatum]